MSTATILGATLREVLLDALTDGYWYQRGEVEDCGHCRRAPAGVCADPDHQDALTRSLEYEEARKRLHYTPEDGEVLAALAALEGGE